MRVAIIFSGGFAGAEWALKYNKIPHEIIFASEIDKFARTLYKANHKAQTFYKDVKDINGKKYKDSIDLLIGGFPCQAFSIAGKRKGFKDTRGTLFFEFARLVSEVEPKYFIAENVKGLLSHDRGNTWRVIQETFRDLGYHITYKVLNSKDYGTPQNRERIFIVGFINIDEYYSFNFPKQVPLSLCLKDVLENKVDQKYFLSEKMLKGFKTHREKHDKRGNGFGFKPKSKDDIANCISCLYGARATDTYLEHIYQKAQASVIFEEEKVVSEINSRGKLNQIANIDQKGHNSLWGRVYDINGISATLNAKGGGAGAKTGLYFIPTNTKAGFVVAKEDDCINLKTLQSKTARGQVSKTAHTIDTQCNQGIVLKSSIRRLTPRECYRLMGDYNNQVDFANLSDTQLYKNAGNGIEIRVFSAILKALLNPSSEGLFKYEDKT